MYCFCHCKDANEVEGPFVGDVVALCAFYSCRNTRIKFLFQSHSISKKIQCYVLVDFECQMRQTKRNQKESWHGFWHIWFWGWYAWREFHLTTWSICKGWLFLKSMSVKHPINLCSHLNVFSLPIPSKFFFFCYKMVPQLVSKIRTCTKLISDKIFTVMNTVCCSG